MLDVDLTYTSLNQKC